MIVKNNKIKYQQLLNRQYERFISENAKRRLKCTLVEKDTFKRTLSKVITKWHTYAIKIDKTIIYIVYSFPDGPLIYQNKTCFFKTNSNR